MDLKPLLAIKILSNKGDIKVPFVLLMINFSNLRIIILVYPDLMTIPDKLRRTKRIECFY